MVLSEVRKELKNGTFEKTFSKLYGEQNLSHQLNRYLDAVDGFQKHFHASDDVEISLYSSPGRTEIGGNHTDHQHGRVIAASVDLDFIGVVMKATEKVHIMSEGYGEDIISGNELEAKETEKNTSAGLARGVLAYFNNNKHKIGGFNVYVTSEVFRGSGLSSSAAFETLIGTILSHEYNGGKVDAVEVAQAGQFAENVYFGKPSGLEDQLASAYGGCILIDFVTPLKPIINKVQLDIGQWEHVFCVVNTGGSHADLTHEYAAITREMKDVSAYFQKSVLRDVNEALFKSEINQVREKYGDRAVIRAMHFFNENTRVKQQAQLLSHNNFDGFLNEVNRSGKSSFCYLQNVYSTGNVMEQGLSLAQALSEELLEGTGAFRIQGGGFAGTIIAFVPNALFSNYENEMNRVFGKGACRKLNIRTVGSCKL